MGISSTSQPELWKNIDKGSYIRRICNSCSRDSHKDIIYKRLTSKGEIDFKDLFLSNWYSDPSGAGKTSEALILICFLLFKMLRIIKTRGSIVTTIMVELDFLEIAALLVLLPKSGIL